jgi:hypothetical protein
MHVASHAALEEGDDVDHPEAFRLAAVTAKVQRAISAPESSDSPPTRKTTSRL